MNSYFRICLGRALGSLVSISIAVVMAPIHSTWAAPPAPTKKEVTQTGSSTPSKAIDEKVSRAVALWNRGGVDDLKESFRLNQEAAETKDSRAEYNLGVMYMTGKGAQKDDKQAVYWFRRAANRGHTLAQFNLAVSLQNGDGLPADATEAVNWYRAASKGGHSVATYNVGVAYSKGVGIAKNDTTAFSYFKQAAEQGYGRAKYSLGMMYLLRLP